VHAVPVAGFAHDGDETLEHRRTLVGVLDGVEKIGNEVEGRINAGFRTGGRLAARSLAKAGNT
jgi:hypothetical protein